MSTPGDGIALSRSYYEDLVRPLLRTHLPHLRCAAARVGAGSDVLGLDDGMSRDHDWGLRLQLFVEDAERGPVLSTLDAHLPAHFRGHPVRFGFSADPVERPRIDVTTVEAFAEQHLGFDPRDGAPSDADWLSLTGQAVLEVTAGAVFEDQTRGLTMLREAVAWYPDHLWRYVVACDWQRLDHALPLIGRAGRRGDELGSRTLAARAVDVAVHLAFLLCRSWAPYAKWRGTWLARLPGCATIAHDLGRALDGRDWHVRQTAMGDALRHLGRLQRAAGLPAPDPVVVPFWDRPFIHLDPRLVPALLDPSAVPEALPAGIGSIEQLTDSVDVLVSPDRRRALTRALLGVRMTR